MVGKKRGLFLWITTAVLIPVLLCSAQVAGNNPVENTKTTAAHESLIQLTAMSAAEVHTVPTTTVTIKPTTTTIGDLYYIPEIPLSKELQSFTYEQCKEKHVSYELVLAVMQQESRFQTDVQGHNPNGSTDNGLMQINSRNEKWLSEEIGIKDLMDPEDNIRAGVFMLSCHVANYGENYGLMAYHMGAGGMLKAKRNGVSSTAYSRSILEQRDIITKMEKSA